MVFHVILFAMGFYKMIFTQVTTYNTDHSIIYKHFVFFNSFAYSSLRDRPIRKILLALLFALQTEKFGKLVIINICLYLSNVEPSSFAASNEWLVSATNLFAFS